jgi:hypothetical protein
MGMLAIAIFWGFALWGLVTPRPVLVYLFFVCLPLGTFAVIPPAMTGGLSLLGSPVAVLLLAIKELGLRPGGTRSLARVALQTKPGRLLLWYWSIGAVVTIFAPAMFARSIEVIPMSGDRLVPTPLVPTTQNFSQLSYVTLSVLAVFTFASIFRRPEARAMLHRGVLVAGSVTVGTGVADFVSDFVPIGPHLGNFRTAQYAILGDNILDDGARRIIGLMPEASSFGALSVSLFALLYFLRPVIRNPQDRRWVNTVLSGLILMIVLSTSSASYVAIALMLFLMLLDWFSRVAGIARPSLARRGMRRELVPAMTVAGSIIVGLMLIPAVFDPVVDRVNDRVFEKTTSDSFDERSMWTEVSLQAGLSSKLVGVGLGSTRASNHLVAVFASTGLLGLLLYLNFMRSLLVSRSDHLGPIDAVFLRALRWSFLPPLAVAILTGTTPDFGVIDGMRWGVLLTLCGTLTDTATSQPRAVEAPVGLSRSVETVLGRPPLTNARHSSTADVPLGRV